MPSLVDRIVRATPAVACACAILIATAFAHAEAPGIVVIEAPLGLPSDVDQLVAKATVAPHSAVTYQAHRPETTWDIFNGFEQTPNRAGQHEVHEHDMFDACESCLAFAQSRREMLARAFDQVIARYDRDEIEADEIEADEIGGVRIRPLEDEVNQDRPTPSQDEPTITIAPISQVGINTKPKLEKSTELPPNLAGKRYVSYQTATAYGGGEAKPWSRRTFCWHAPSFYHRPLYFEQVNLERYGHYRRNWHIESILSAAHFFGSIPLLPLQLGAYHPCERVYTLGRYRPGDCNPNHKYLIPITWHGILKQGLTTTALVFAL